MPPDRPSTTSGGQWQLAGTTNLGGGYGMFWWIDREHPAVVVDGGAYRVMPWLDNDRGYGVIVLLEAEARMGAALRLAIQPSVDAAFDAAN